MSAKNFRKSDGGGIAGNGSFRSKHLAAARSLSAKDWEKPNDILKARHMAHDGASLADITIALGWTCSRQTADNRLRKYNIRPLGNRRAHRGKLTTCPPNDTTEGAIAANFRPRILEGA